MDLIKLEIKALKEKSEEDKIKNDIMKKKLEEISVKVMDFNIYDLFKENTVGGGSIDAAKVLIKNLEQKFTQKNEHRSIGIPQGDQKGGPRFYKK